MFAAAISLPAEHQLATLDQDFDLGADVNRLGAPTGIAVGLLLAVPIWGVVGSIVYFII